MEFWEHELWEYVVKKGIELNQPVQDFIDNHLTVYEGEPELDSDAQTHRDFEKAVEACCRWVRTVLCLDIVGSKVSSKQRAVLQLPDKRLNICVEDVPSDVFDGGTALLWSSDAPAYVQELVQTPIGDISYSLYRAIIDAPVNPIRTLYLYFHLLLRNIHTILSLREDDDFITKSLLEDENIVDVLGVYRLDGVLSNIDDFLKGQVG